MKLFILTLGTRGDLELFLNLGVELRGRGHQVTVGASHFYRQRVEAAGLEAIPIGEGRQDQLYAVLRSLAGVRDKTERTRQYYLRWLRKELSSGAERIASCVGGANYFVSNLKLLYERHGGIVPCALVTYDPPLDDADLDRFGVSANNAAVIQLAAMNRSLVDRDALWPEHFVFTGFWQSSQSAAQTVDPRLAEFVKEAPPVVVTMGSMVSFDPNLLANHIAEALRLSGQRGVIVRGWSESACLGAKNQNVLVVDEAPYAWLFPRASCIIHHGGCGTLAEVLRAGKPSILIPQIACQERFAQMLGREKLTAGEFDADSFTPAELAAAIARAVSEQEIADNARRWQEIVAADGGLTEAAGLIERHWNRCHEVT